MYLKNILTYTLLTKTQYTDIRYGDLGQMDAAVWALGHMDSAFRHEDI